MRQIPDVDQEKSIEIELTQYLKVPFLESLMQQ